MSEPIPPRPVPHVKRPVIHAALPHGEVENQPAEQPRPSARLFRLMTVPLFAGMIFAVCGLLAAGSVEFTLRKFAQEGGVSSVTFVVVPGLFAMLFALLVYQGAQQRVKRVAESVSRGLLVGLLTWASFAALATWVWCRPENYVSCYGNFLLASGVIGGGPMLMASVTAGALVGWIIKQKNLASLFD
jgi:hypothetical protein